MPRADPVIYARIFSQRRPDYRQKTFTGFSEIHGLCEHDNNLVAPVLKSFLKGDGVGNAAVIVVHTVYVDRLAEHGQTA